jgi:DNA-binding NarL/FixJ family response regulator
MNARTAEPRRSRKSVLLVDDHPVLRRGLKALIDSDPGLFVCAEAASCSMALAAIRATRPDLVIVDLALEGSDGLDLVKEMKIRHPRIPALVLTMYDEAVYAERALRAGARGYVTKSQLDDTVLKAIGCLLGGEVYMSEGLKSRFAEKYLRGRTLETDSRVQTLSDRELRVFQLIGQGRTTRQIAGALNLSIKTIETHRDHIKRKLMVESAAELTRRAVQWVETGRCN